MKLLDTKTVPNPWPGRDGFPIPEFFRDWFNKIFRKEQSVYTRQESPSITIPEFGWHTYRGVPAYQIDRLIIKYDDPVLPVEIHTVHRDPEGYIVKITKVLTDKTLEQLGIDPALIGL